MILKLGILRKNAWLKIRKKMKVETADIFIKIWKQRGGLFMVFYGEKKSRIRENHLDKYI